MFLRARPLLTPLPDQRSFNNIFPFPRASSREDSGNRVRLMYRTYGGTPTRSARLRGKGDRVNALRLMENDGEDSRGVFRATWIVSRCLEIPHSGE